MNRITDMTWMEIREATEKGALALLPVASMEQHGPHLPVKTDTLLVTRAAEATAQQLHDQIPIVLAPTLWLGASHHHRKFFALSVDELTYIAMIRQIAFSLAEAGFRRLFLLNGHGGNSAPLRVALTRIRDEQPDMLVGIAEYWGLTAKAIRGLRKSEPGGAAHGGEFETSLMMFLQREAVRGDALRSNVPRVPPGFEVDLVDKGSVTLGIRVDALSKTGQIGEGELASVEQGQRFFDAVVEATSKMILSFANLDVGALAPDV